MLNALGYKSSFLQGVLPDRLSPGIQLITGVYNYTTAWRDGKKWKMKLAENQIRRAGEVMIPGSNAMRSYMRAINEPLSLFFYTGKKEEPKRTIK